MKFKNERLDRLAHHSLLTPALLAAAAICLGILALWFAPVYRLRSLLFASYFMHPLILLLNLLPPLFLALLLYFLSGRAGLSYLLTAGLTLGLAFANYFKLTLRNDAVIFEDLLLLREAGDMAGKYHIFLNLSMAVALVLAALGWFFLLRFARARTSRKPRLICFCAFLLLGLCLRPLYTDPVLYIASTANYDHVNIYSATEIYVSKGFLYPFLYSAGFASDKPPQGYSEKGAKTLLAGYRGSDIPEWKKVDLIGIQLEAYADFTRLGVPALKPAVYEKLHALEAEGYSGNLVTNVFAGGTVDTERCFLTGLTLLPNFRVPTNSYVWYLRSQGYYTGGGHPCYSWFYNRESINRNLGFEHYYFTENRYSALAGGDIGFDNVFLPDLLTLYKEHKASSDAPYFSFHVTYQGHGPYSEETNWSGKDLLTGGSAYSEGERNLMNNYFASIQDTTDYLAELFDYFRASPDPVVLVIYGDHKPWMGNNNSVYALLGIDLDLSNRQGFFNYYSTRYLIWANDAAKVALGSEFRGEGPDLSPSFLMDRVFQLCGWEGPAYMQATRDLMEHVSVVNTDSGLFLEDGVLTGALSAENQTRYLNYQYLQYYWRRNAVK